MAKAKQIKAWNKYGAEFVFESIKQASIGLGVSRTTIFNRLKDRYPILIPEGTGIYVAEHNCRDWYKGEKDVR